MGPSFNIYVTKRSVLAEEGSPWTVSFESSCLVNSSNVALYPRLLVSLALSGKDVVMIAEYKIDLLNQDWRKLAPECVEMCLTSMSDRAVYPPNSFAGEVAEAFLAARTEAIASMIRQQAAHLISHVPSAEACRIWSEAEVAMIMNG